MEDNDEKSKVVDLLKEIRSEESSLKKVSLSVASVLLSASIIGSVVLYKEFLHIQGWVEHHESVAAMHIERIGALETQANKGGRWTLGDHNNYAQQQSSRLDTYSQRIGILERATDITEYKIEGINDKLDEIISTLKQIPKSVPNNPQHRSGM